MVQLVINCQINGYLEFLITCDEWFTWCLSNSKELVEPCILSYMYVIYV